MYTYILHICITFVILLLENKIQGSTTIHLEVINKESRYVENWCTVNATVLRCYLLVFHEFSKKTIEKMENYILKEPNK